MAIKMSELQLRATQMNYTNTMLRETQEYMQYDSTRIKFKTRQNESLLYQKYIQVEL